MPGEQKSHDWTTLVVHPDLALEIRNIAYELVVVKSLMLLSHTRRSRRRAGLASKTVHAG